MPTQPHAGTSKTHHSLPRRRALQAGGLATDMALKYAGPDNVRAFIASIGLGETRIPDSTRQFFGFVASDPDWRNLTWDRVTALLALTEQPGGAAAPHRWVYFSFLINWTDDVAGPVAEGRASFDAAAHQMFTLLRDRLGG